MNIVRGKMEPPYTCRQIINCIPKGIRLNGWPRLRWRIQPIQKENRTELKIHTLTVTIMPGSEMMFL